MYTKILRCVALLFVLTKMHSNQLPNLCTHLKDCLSLSWLNNINDTSTFDEKIQLFGKNCPRDNNTILVNCPSVEQELDCETDCDPTTFCGPKNGNCTDVG